MRGRWGSSLLPPPDCPLPRPLTSSTPGPPPAPSPRRPRAPLAGPRARPLAWRLPAGLSQPGPFPPPRTLSFLAARRGPARSPSSDAQFGLSPGPGAGFVRRVSPHCALQPPGSVRPFPCSFPPGCNPRLTRLGTFLGRNWGACFASQPTLGRQWPTLRGAPRAPQ